MTSCLTYELPVVPALVVHPLAEQFYGRLGAVCLQHGHVQIIDEEDEALAQRRTEHTLTSDVHTHINKYTSQGYTG